MLFFCSRLTLNSEGGGTVSQVSGGKPLHSVPSSTSSKVIGGSVGGGGEVQNPLPNKRGLMLKSYSHDTSVTRVSDTRLEVGLELVFCLFGGMMLIETQS